MEDNFDISKYLGNNKIYSKEHPKKYDEDEDIYEPASIPEDVLSGQREWKLTGDINDPRNREGIFYLEEE